MVNHLVFSTKNRVPFLPEPIQIELYPYLIGIMRNPKCQPIQIGGVEDHIHFLFGLGISWIREVTALQAS